MGSPKPDWASAGSDRLKPVLQPADHAGRVDVRAARERGGDVGGVEDRGGLELHVDALGDGDTRLGEETAGVGDERGVDVLRGVGRRAGRGVERGEARAGRDLDHGHAVGQRHEVEDEPLELDGVRGGGADERARFVEERHDLVGEVQRE